MDPTEGARKSAGAIVDLPSGFMMDAKTYERGSQLGFQGLDFYAAGRGGALGEVPAAVVSAAFVFFNPETVAKMWEASAGVMDRHDAARAFASCAESWAEEHLADEIDYDRLADLAGAVIRSASPAGLALFAGWAQMDEPTGSFKALALHRLNVLRELRGSLHGAAVISSGLDPRAAVMLRAPQMAAIFGWAEPHPEYESLRPTWDAAEAATNLSMGRRLAVLDDAQLSEFVELAVGAAAGRI